MRMEAMVNAGVCDPAIRVAQPVSGDLVVALQVGNERRYTIAQLPGAPQVSWRSRDAVLDVARGFARRHLVDVWISDGRFTIRLESHRPVPSVGGCRR